MFVRLSDRHVELLDRQFHQDEVLEFELNRARHQVSAHIFEIEAPYRIVEVALSDSLEEMEAVDAPV